MDTEVWQAGIEADLATIRTTDARLAERLDGRLWVMHGNGNVIAVFDAAPGETVPDPASMTREICSAVPHVRIDGVSFLTRVASQRVQMRYFDRDGTLEPMCGNALRCVGQFVFDRQYVTGTLGVIDTDDGPREVRLDSGMVLACLGEPREFHQVEDDQWFVFTGCAHLVLERAKVERLDVKRLGSALRYDEELCRKVGHPEGVHVDFVESLDGGLRVRTYEPGVEDETLACGTGVAASAYTWRSRARLTLPTQVSTNGGVMTVDVDPRGHIWISGVVGYLSGREGETAASRPQASGPDPSAQVATRSGRSSRGRWTMSPTGVEVERGWSAR